MDDRAYQALKGIWHDRIHSRRGLLNKFYEQLGFSAIYHLQQSGITGLEYLVDNQNEKYKAGILRELGRWDTEAIKELAIAICNQETKPKTIREWVRVLKSLRLKGLSETVSENQEV